MSESTCISIGGVGNSVAGVGHQLLGWYLYTTLAVSYPTLALSYPTLALIDTSLKGSRVKAGVAAKSLSPKSTCTCGHHPVCRSYCLSCSARSIQSLCMFPSYNVGHETLRVKTFLGVTFPRLILLGRPYNLLRP